MYFLRYILLAVTLLVAIAGAERPPKVAIAGAERITPPPKATTLLRARAAHRVSVRVPDLHWAAIEGDVAEVKRLIAAGADLNATETLWGGERALHWAAHGGSDVVRALIAAGASLEARDDAGDTALFESLRPDDGGYLALTALLAAGANPNAVRSGGWSPLHEAVGIEHERGWNAVYLLRLFGADPNLAGSFTGSVSGITPLHLAVLRPRDDFWGDSLMDASIDPHQRVANVNAKDSLGQTPLHWLFSKSVSAKDRSVMNWLEANGADVNAVDNYGSTPLDWAEFGGYAELAGVLRGMGGVNRRRPPDLTP